VRTFSRHHSTRLQSQLACTTKIGTLKYGTIDYREHPIDIYRNIFFGTATGSLRPPTRYNLFSPLSAKFRLTDPAAPRAQHETKTGCKRDRWSIETATFVI
jgi:hypothetical protein